MIHPSTALQWISEEIGFGVIATQDLLMGTITVVPDPLDLTLTKDEINRLPEPLKSRAWHFMYMNADSHFILSWDHARYINHSCHANTMLSKQGFEIAIRDIKQGEQITSEYGLLRAQEELIHRCPQDPCRGIVRVNDYELLYEQWAPMLAHALKQVPFVEQALAPLLSKSS